MFVAGKQFPCPCANLEAELFNAKYPCGPLLHWEQLAQKERHAASFYHELGLARDDSRILPNCNSWPASFYGPHEYRFWTLQDGFLINAKYPHVRIEAATFVEGGDPGDDFAIAYGGRDPHQLLKRFREDEEEERASKRQRVAYVVDKEEKALICLPAPVDESTEGSPIKVRDPSQPRYISEDSDASLATMWLYIQEDLYNLAREEHDEGYTNIAYFMTALLDQLQTMEKELNALHAEWARSVANGNVEGAAAARKAWNAKKQAQRAEFDVGWSVLTRLDLADRFVWEKAILEDALLV